jgi:hypothetical protein
MSYIEAFNNQMDSFIRDLETSYSDKSNVMSDIRNFRTAISIMRRINQKKVVENVMYYIYPYKNQIVQGDEDFFFNHGFEDELKDARLDGDKGFMRAMHFKTLYRESSDSNKEAIKKYFKVLILLGEKALNLA